MNVLLSLCLAMLAWGFGDKDSTPPEDKLFEPADVKQTAFVCDKGTLKIARCTNQEGVSTDFPVSDIQVCEREDRSLVMQAKVVDQGQEKIAPKGLATAERIGPNQVEYYDPKHGTSLVLNADRQGGLIRICTETGERVLHRDDAGLVQETEIKRECVAKPAVCK